MIYQFRRLPIARLGAAAAMTFLASFAWAQDDTVVATIDGKSVTEADLAIAMSDLDQQFAQLPAEQRRVAALSALIEINLLAKKAESEGIADSKEFKERMEILRQRALHSAYIDQTVASGITDEAVRAEYDKQVAALPAAEEVHARHILVPTKEEAVAIIAEVNAGGDFEAIAKEKSQDGAAAQGGDLGYFGQGQMVPEFEKAAFALKAGEISSEPVQTQFGWHVIKVEDRRAQKPPAFEEVQGQIRSGLLRNAYFETVKALRESAKIEIMDEKLKAVIEPAIKEAGETETPKQ